MCRSKVSDRTAKSPYKKPQHQQPRRASTSSNGKGGGKQFFKKKTPKKQPPKQKAYEVTFKPKTVLKEPSGGENAGNVSNSVPSGKGSEEEGTYNRFSCFAVHSQMAQSTNTKSKSSERLYTDTDPDHRSEIITDVTIRVPGKPGTMLMEVKVDPGAQPKLHTITAI